MPRAPRLVLFAVLLGSLLGTSALLSSPATAQPGWAVTPSPNVSASEPNTLSGVSCTDPSFCAAVGSYDNGSLTQTLIETWDGASWTTSPSPDVGAAANYLEAVSCTSPQFCIAVGYEFNDAAIAQTLIERWDGSKWTASASPDFGTGNNYLYGVSCTSSSFCAAVGSAYSSDLSADQPLAETWDGSSWAVSAVSESSDSESSLRAVSCISIASCVAVGDFSNATGVTQTLVEAWDGASWTTSPSPNSGSGNNYLEGVSCTSTSFCAAVGYYYTETITQALAEIWDGSSWTINNSPSQVPSNSLFEADSCTSSTFCMGVGWYYNPSAVVDQTLAETANGSASQNVGPSNNQFSAVSCTSSSFCAAVGSYNDGGILQTLAETWGQTPNPSPSPSPSPVPSPSPSPAPVPSPAPSPPPPSSACTGSTGNAAFLCAAYEDILGRSPDPGGSALFEAQLAQGTSRTQVAYELATSAEYRNDLVDHYYEAYLGRSPDSVGLSDWVSQLDAGVSDRVVLAAILGSEEFYTDCGGSPSAFVSVLYSDLLGRPADPGGLSYWTGQLSSGSSLTTVAAAILASNEHLTDFVEAEYLDLLGRPADASGLSFWVSQLAAGASSESVIAGIVGSTEFLIDAAKGNS